MDPTVAINPSVLYFGTPVVLLSTAMPDGATNLTPMSSAWALGRNYVLGLSRHSQGAENLLRTREVVINLVDASMAGAVERIAPTTGSRDVPAHKASQYRYVADKWSASGLTPVGSELVRPDRVADCPVQIECQLVASHSMGDSALIFEVESLLIHAQHSVVQPGTSHIDLDKWVPLFYTFRHYFAQGHRVGVSFKAEQ